MRLTGFYFSGFTGTDAAGPQMESAMNMMELDGLASDIDALFGIAGLKEDLMDVVMLGGSAGVSVVAGELLFSKVPVIRDQPMWVKALAAVALGAGGGIAIGRFAPQFKAVGAGVAAGLVGWGVAQGIRMGASKAGMSLGQVSDRDLLLGMGAIDNDINVTDYRPVPGQTNGLGGDSVTDYRPIPGQTDGLGQAGDVTISDVQPMPGVNGRDGYLSALVA